MPTEPGTSVTSTPFTAGLIPSMTTCAPPWPGCAVAGAAARGSAHAAIVTAAGNRRICPKQRSGGRPTFERLKGGAARARSSCMEHANGLAGAFDAPGGPLQVRRAAGTVAATSGAIECVLDGFVANAADIGAQLGLPGHDAEVLAAAYARLGEPLLGRLRGDFVCLLWNRDERRGVIARDQLGGRSLHFRRQGRGVLFASEVRELLAMLPATPGPDRTVLLHWLSMRHHIGPETPYEGVEALLPGQLLRLGPDGVALERYWTPAYREPRRYTREEAAAVIRRDVDRALDRTTAGCDAVGVMMSGGLDSTSIAVLADQRPLDVRGYSAVFPDMPFVDESGYIDRIADGTGLPVSRMEVHGGSMLRSALRFSRDWGLPLASQNLEFWLPLLGRAAGDGVDVMLDGEGGDMLFAARPELIGDRLRHGRLLSAAQLVRALPGGADQSRRALASVLLARGGRAALPAGLHDAIRLRGAASRHTVPWLSPADGRHVVETDGDWDWKRLDGPRWWARLADACSNGLHSVGIRDHQRRQSLMAGVETRSPFFDVDLVETMLSMPPELAFDPLSRPLQRDIVAGELDDVVRLRPDKSYFDELFYKSLAVEDAAAVSRLLTAPGAALRDWVDLDVVRTRLLEPGPKASGLGVRFWLKSVWRLATAECWLRELAEPGFADASLDSLGLAPPQIAFTGPAAPSAA